MVLITGVAGFIGYSLAKKLLEQDETVAGIDNMNTYYDVRLKEDCLAQLKKYDTFSFYQGGIQDKEFVDRVFMEIHPKLVINLAAQPGVRYSITHPQVYIESNIIGFFNVIEACHNYVSEGLEHLIYASSSSVYGRSDKVPYATTDKVDMPVSLYAETKRSDELIAYSYSQLYQIPCTGL